MSDEKMREPSRTARAVEMVRVGSSCTAAARVVGVRVGSVWRACKRLGVPVRRRGQLSTDGASALAAAMVADGSTYREAAKSIGISEAAVRSACKRRGVRSRHRVGGNRRLGGGSLEGTELLERAVRMVSDGATIKGAARMLGVARGTVSSACKSRGVRSCRSRGVLDGESRSAKAAKMVADGHSIHATARAFGISTATVFGACKARGVVSRYSRKHVERRA